MRRRAVIAALLAAAVRPVGVRAQQPAMPVIGFLGSASPDLWADRLRAFRQGLGETGYAEGKNVAIEYRWADGQNDRLPALAADLVRRQVSVIVVLSNTPAAFAAKAASSAIPVVFGGAFNPVELGLVDSLNRPGGNLTGVTTSGVEVGPKRLEVLHGLVPRTSVVALLVNPTNPAIAEIQLRDLSAAAGTLGLQLHVLNASTDRDLAAIFPTLAQLQAGGLVIGADAFFSSRNGQLAALAVRNGVPTISSSREFPAAGGLMSYGGSTADASRQIGVYTGRVLRGEKPAELPVQQAVKVELVINLKTAKALGLEFPPTLLARADEVIE